MSNVRVLSAAPLLQLLENWLPPPALMPLLENGACWSWPSSDATAHATASFFFAFAKGIVVGWLCLLPQQWFKDLDQHGRHFAVAAARARLSPKAVSLQGERFLARQVRPQSCGVRACDRGGG